MAKAKKNNGLRVYDGQRTPGGMPWEAIPEWVRERVNNEPFDATEEDRRIQALYPGYFVVRTPFGQKEIWVTSPPRNRAGISRVCRVHYPDEPCPPIDERALWLLLKFDPERGMDTRQIVKEAVASHKRLMRDKKAQTRLQFRLMGEDFQRLITTPGRFGQLATPVRSIIVPDSLR